jgi:hypothetical protein
MPKVNGVFALAVLATVALSMCGSAQTAKPPMVGRWRGVGTIVVPWPRQRTLVVDLTILANDSVAGKVGDATLVGGWIITRDPGSRSSLRWKCVRESPSRTRSFADAIKPLQSRYRIHLFDPRRG